MITLKDILQLNETVTLLKLWVRKPDGKLIVRSVIGQKYRPTRYELDDIEKGKMEYIDADINHYGRIKKSGMSETSYSMDYKAIPKKYLEAEVVTLERLKERYGGVYGAELNATIVPIQIRLDDLWTS